MPIPRTSSFFLIVFFCCLILLVATPVHAQPGEPLDYAELAFYPDRWEQLGIETTFYPWVGEEVVLLTRTSELDAEVMALFIERLDAGWALYREIIGTDPRDFKLYDGRPTIAAVPDARLTCGAGCGYIGATGIEVANFYHFDYDLVSRQREAFAHYYFYEMGRNYFLFGDRHSEFETGFAVFMRYVCMDALECVDPDAATRDAIVRAEAAYAETELSFLDAFTNQGRFTEKVPRLQDFNGPCDQPVMYASAMLLLRSEYGGDEFVSRMYQYLLSCPLVPSIDADSALRQALNWVVSASCAARQDLTPVFVQRWRLPLDAATQAALAEVDWADPETRPVDVLEAIEFGFVD